MLTNIRSFFKPWAPLMGFLLLTLLGGRPLPAQDLKGALARMQQLYTQSEKLHIVMRIEAFEGTTSSKPYYKEQADIKKEFNNYRYHFGSTEMLLNGRFMIVVDHAAQQLMYNRRKEKGENVFAGSQMNIDSLFRFYENPEYLGKKGQVHQYRIVQKKGPVDEIELAIHAETGLLTRMQYHYREGPIIAIHFLVFDPKPQFEAGVFSEAAYLQSAGVKVRAASSYTNYHLSQGGKN